MRSFSARPMRRGLAALSVAALIGLTAACSGGPSGSGPGGVPVTLRDFSVILGSSSLPAGSNQLAIQNSGATVHELEVFTVPTGVDPAAIPVVNGVADTNSVGMTVVDEVEDIAPGTGKSLTVNLEPGTYVFMCNLPTHYGLGMHATVTVQ
jgi:plastocyanin